MAEAIREYADATGREVGLKLAGGIRTSKQALGYLALVAETLGAGWLHPRPLPPRRLDPPERHRAAAALRAHGALRPHRRPPGGLDRRRPPPQARPPTGDLAQTFSDYVPSLEGRDIVAIRPRYGLVIGGEEREPRDGGELATIEPATGDHLAVVAEASARRR